MLNLQKIVEQIYSKQKLYVEHLENQYQKFKTKNNECDQSLDYIYRFFKNFQNETNIYIKKLNTLLDNNQKTYEQYINDQYLNELFQMILLGFSKMVEDFEEKQQAIEEQVKFFDQGFSNYDKKVKQVVNDYQQQIKTTKNDLQEQQNFYQSYLNCKKKLEQRTQSQRFIKESMQQKVENFRNQAQMHQVKFEVNMKDNSIQIKQQIESVKDLEKLLVKQIGQKTKIFYKQQKFDEQLVTNLKVYLQNKKYHSYYKDILSRICCQFSDDIYLGSSSSNFYSYDEIQKITNFFNSSFLQNILQKMDQVSSKIDPRVKIFIDLVLEKVFKQEQIDQKVNIEKLHLILENKNGLDYFLYKMYTSKVILMQIDLFAPIVLNQNTFEFLEKVVKLILFLVHNYYDEIIENIYSLMKFTHYLKDRNHKTVLSQTSQQILFLNNDFWLKTYNYIYGQIFSSADSNITQNIKSFFFKDSNHKKHIKNQAFQETASTMFQTQLNYNKICENLLFIASNADIDTQNVQLLLFRNMDLFNEQISTYYINEQFKGKTKIKQDKEMKIAQIFKNILIFLQPNDLQKFVTQFYLNRKMFEIIKKVRIQKWVLQSTHRLSQKTRLYLLKEVISQNNVSLDMIKDFGEDEQTQSDQIIKLDVQRTFNHDSNFDKKGLEIILKNIASNKVGSFSYYQGLNYIVAYFYILFDQNTEKTFEFVMPLIQKHLVSYMDQKLEGLKRLLYIHKKLLKIYFLDLYEYFQTTVKIDTDIVYASWCLTLFCAINQYKGDSYLLNDIIDIFVAKGWCGYFQVVMVIMDELKEEIQQSDNEQLLIFFSELPKSNFQKITQKYQNDFNFKAKINKYQSVNKFLIGSLSYEYNILLEKKSDFWHDFQKQSSIKSNEQLILQQQYKFYQKQIQI